MTWGAAPYSQLRVAAAPGHVEGWSGLRFPCCSIPGPRESSESVKPMAELVMVIPGIHQLSLLSTGILPGGGELIPFPGSHLQKERKTLSWQLCMLDLLRQAEPQDRLICLQCLQNQGSFHSIPAEQNSVLIRQGCCRSSRKGLVLVSQRKV